MRNPVGGILTSAIIVLIMGTDPVSLKVGLGTIGMACDASGNLSVSTMTWAPDVSGMSVGTV